MLLKISFIFFLLVACTAQAQDAPQSRTRHFGLRQYSQNAHPSADSLNQNLTDIDTALYDATFLLQGVDSLVPTLRTGELFWATDTETFYVGTEEGENKAFYSEQPDMVVVNTDTMAVQILLDCKKKNKFFVPFRGVVDLDFINLKEGKWISVFVDNSFTGTGSPTFSSVTFSTDEPEVIDPQITFYSFIKINDIIYGASKGKYPVP